jgi:predicted porin
MAGGTFRVSQAQTDQAGKIAKQMSVGFVQPMSKRTDLYATYARVSNSGGSAVALNGASTAANASSTGYEFGVKHAF